MENKYVIGNVGRLHFQKNQKFAIDVFNEYHKDNPDSVLVLVGQGEDEDDLKKQVASYGLKESVLFTGVQKDIQEWLSCFDLFLFPSRFEGLSMVALEAQANGLPVLASQKAIPDGIKMYDHCVSLSLEEPAIGWSERLGEMKCLERVPFSQARHAFEEQGYDISVEIKKLERMLDG